MRRFLFAATLFLLPGPHAHAAQDCPAGSSQLDAIVKAVEAAPTCSAAYRIMEACAFGSSADVQTGAAVVQKCEKVMATTRRTAFQRESKACAARYAKMEGTMYISMAAFCSAKAAVAAADREGR